MFELRRQYLALLISGIAFLLSIFDIFLYRQMVHYLILVRQYSPCVLIFMLASSSVKEGLAFTNPTSKIIFKEYFLWFIRIPFDDLLNSMPRKNFKSPTSLILKTFCRENLGCSMRIKLLHVTNISSTYTRITTMFKPSFFMDNE